MAQSYCKENPYMTPRLYVEGLESDEYLTLRGGEAVIVRKCGEGRCFGKTIYGSVIDEIVDLMGKKARRSFITVLPPNYNKGILVEAGTILEPIPLEGMRVVVEVCEGQKLGLGDTVGFVATRKFEVRHVRSHVGGIVVYVYSNPEAPPDQVIVLVAPEGEVKLVHVRPGES